MKSDDTVSLEISTATATSTKCLCVILQSVSQCGTRVFYNAPNSTCTSSLIYADEDPMPYWKLKIPFTATPNCAFIFLIKLHVQSPVCITRPTFTMWVRSFLSNMARHKLRTQSTRKPSTKRIAQNEKEKRWNKFQNCNWTPKREDTWIPTRTSKKHWTLHRQVHHNIIPTHFKTFPDIWLQSFHCINFSLDLWMTNAHFFVWNGGIISTIPSYLVDKTTPYLCWIRLSYFVTFEWDHQICCIHFHIPDLYEKFVITF